MGKIEIKCGQVWEDREETDVIQITNIDYDHADFKIIDHGNTWTKERTYGRFRLETIYRYYRLSQVSKAKQILENYNGN